MNYTLKRSYTDQGTFGKLYDSEDKVICYTVEQLWKDNKPFVSCIPEGKYKLVDFKSSKYGETVALVNHDNHVYAHKNGPGDRYACLLHAANYAPQLQGCIAPGSKLGVVSGHWAVLNSRNTLKSLRLTSKDTILITK